MKTEIFEKIPAITAALPHPVPQFVVVSGSWKDMGRQYAQQAKDELSIRIAEMLGDYIEIFGSYEKTCLVIADYLAPARADFPQLIELLEGMAEVLGFTPEICAILLYGKSMIRVELENCSHCASWGESTSSGHLIAAANVDMDTTTTNYLPCILAFPEDGNSFICGENFHRNAINDKGVVFTMSGGQNAGPGGTAKGDMRHMWNDAELFAIPYSSTAAEALKVYKDRKYVVGCNQFIGDLSHDAYMLEFTADKFCVRRAGDNGEKDFLLANNGYISPELKENLATGFMYWSDCMPRYWTVEKILSDNVGKIDLDTLREAEACYDYYIPEGWSYVKHEGWRGVGEWVKGDEAPYAAGWHKGQEAPFGQWTPQMRGMFGAAYRYLMDAEDRSFYVMKGESSQLYANTPGATGTFCKVQIGGDAVSVVKRAKMELNALLEKAERETEAAAGTHSPAPFMIRSAMQDNASCSMHSAGSTESRVSAIHEARGYLLKGITALGMALCAGSMTSTEDHNYYLGQALTYFCSGQCYARLAMDDPFKIE